RPFKLRLLRAEVDIPELGEGEAFLLRRGGGRVLGGLPAVEHEVFDTTARRHRDEVALQEPEQLLGGGLVGGGVGGRHLADREGGGACLVGECDAPAAVTALGPGHRMTLSLGAIWGQY